MCLELEGKPESHLPAESKDLVILSSQMQHPTHILRGGMEDVGGAVSQYSCYTATAFLESAVAVGVLHQGLSMSRGHQSFPGGGEIALPRPMGRRQENKLTMAPAAVGAPGSP